MFFGNNWQMQYNDRNVGGGEKFSAFQAHAQPAIFRIW